MRYRAQVDKSGSAGADGKPPRDGRFATRKIVVLRFGSALYTAQLCDVRLYRPLAFSEFATFAFPLSALSQNALTYGREGGSGEPTARSRPLLLVLPAGGRQGGASSCCPACCCRWSERRGTQQHNSTQATAKKTRAIPFCGKNVRRPVQVDE